MNKTFFKLRAWFIFFFHKLWFGSKLFLQNEGPMVASSVTFYAIISIFPLTLLTFSVLGHILGGYEQLVSDGLIFIKEFFPDLPHNILGSFKNLLYAQARKSSSLNLFHLLLLFISSHGFFHSSFAGLNTITKTKAPKKFKRYIKSFLAVGVTISFLLTIILMNSLLLLSANLLQEHINLSQLISIIPIKVDFLITLERIITQDLKKIILSENFFFGITLLMYMTLFFKFSFRKSIELKDALVGSLSFVLLFLLGKALFLFYLYVSRKNLVQNYGEFYTFVVVILWMYYLSSSFFMSACIAFNKVKVKES